MPHYISSEIFFVDRFGHFLRNLQYTAGGVFYVRKGVVFVRVAVKCMRFFAKTCIWGSINIICHKLFPGILENHLKSWFFIFMGPHLGVFFVSARVLFLFARRQSAWYFLLKHVFGVVYRYSVTNCLRAFLKIAQNRDFHQYPREWNKHPKNDENQDFRWFSRMPEKSLWQIMFILPQIHVLAKNLMHFTGTRRTTTPLRT